MSGQKLWASILTGVKSQVSASTYKTWFSGSYLLECKKSGGRDILVVGTKSSFLKEQLETRYRPLVLEAAKKEGLGNCDILFVVSKQEKATAPTAAAPLFSGIAQTFITSHRKSDALNPNHTFENFVVSPANNLAHLAAVQAASNLGSLYNPLFIWGPTGVGKTHLMQAFGNYVLSNVLDSKVLYVSAEKFTNDFLEALNNHSMQAFRQKYRSVDVLLVDDIQFLAGKDSTQDEFFYTFNELYLSGRQIVVVADRHPKELGKIKDRLVSRFLGGMTVDLPKADVDLRSAILKTKCAEKGIVLADDVISYIAEVCDSGARELEGVLVQVLSQIRLSSGKVGLMEIKRTLANTPLTPRRSISAGGVIEAVCKHFKISREDLCGPVRKSAFVYPRQVLMYLLRLDLGLQLDGVGELIGGRDHSTVLYGVEKIAKQIAIDLTKRDEIVRIRANF